MQIRTILGATATALLLSSGSLGAQSSDIVDSIVREIVDMGYSRIEVKASATSIKVEATGEAGRIERVYDRDGNLVKEEFDPADGGTSTGTTTSDDTREDDDHDDDGERDDDSGDDGDDGDSGDDGDDSDSGDHDGGDDGDDGDSGDHDGGDDGDD